MLRASADAALLMFFAHRIQTDPIPQRVGTAVESVTTL
jgi:hypothetical protein